MYRRGLAKILGTTAPKPPLWPSLVVCKAEEVQHFPTLSCGDGTVLSCSFVYGHYFPDDKLILSDVVIMFF